VGDSGGAEAGHFFGMRRGAGVGDHVGAVAAVGGTRGCLRPSLPGTGGGIITGGGNRLAVAGSRIGIASPFTARPAAFCLSVADSVLDLAVPWLAGMYAGSTSGATISGSRLTSSIAIS